ncbi:MAG: T9SS type A sorting domain-containing protein, partial [Bacteroidota bacterium]
AIKVREKRPDYENPGDSLFLSTTARAFVIDVDSSMIVSSILEPNTAAEISLFPNPTHQRLFLEFAEANRITSLEIFRSDGQRVYHHSKLLPQAGHSTLEIDTQGWQPGLYQVLLWIDGKRVVRSVVVQ